MRHYEATEGDIRLRRGARIKKKTTKQGCVEESRSAPPFWNVRGGGGLFIYTADEYPHAHIDSGIFFL